MDLQEDNFVCTFAVGVVVKMHLAHTSDPVSQGKQLREAQRDLAGSALGAVLCDAPSLRGRNVCLLPKDKCMLHTMGNSQLCLFFCNGS